MRFIKKSPSPPDFLLKWISEFKESGSAPKYGDLDSSVKNNLRTILFKEQREICCYCEQEITNDRKSVIEHFLPQSKFANHQLDYYNIHLSCTQDNKFCDTIKRNELIVNVLLHPECSSFFKYNFEGEILPNSSYYKNFEDFLKNEKKYNLRNIDLAVIHLILVLNLNDKYLVNERKKTISDLLSLKKEKLNTKQKIEDYIDKELSKAKSTRFPSLIFYFLNFWKSKIKS